AGLCRALQGFAGLHFNLTPQKLEEKCVIILSLNASKSHHYFITNYSYRNVKLLHIYLFFMQKLKDGRVFAPSGTLCINWLSPQ
ncbi:hypothetical protein NEP02_12115, partial [Escherichia coli]|uniref:hypothetical protein n=2 Tax=Escherichia coli TaxID=562 RepID=UPI001BB48260